MKLRTRSRHGNRWPNSNTMEALAYHEDSALWTGTGPVAHSLNAMQSSGTEQVMTDCPDRWVAGFKDCWNWKNYWEYGVYHGGDVPRTFLLSGCDPNGSGAGLMFIPASAIIRGVPDYYTQGMRSTSLVERDFFDERIPTSITIDRGPIESDFSIWYLLVDLVQLNGLFEQIFGSVPRLLRMRRLRARIGRSVPPVSTWKALADAHLLAIFGVIPTVEDVKTFLQLMQKFTDNYEDMLRTLRDFHMLHEKPVKLELARVYPMQNLKPFTGVSVGGLQFERRVQKTLRDDVVFRRNALYKFTAPELAGWMSRVKQFCDTFGVLDRPRLFDAGAIVYDYCESSKRRESLAWFSKWNEPRDGHDFTVHGVMSDWQDIGVENRTVYVRRRFRPPPVLRVPPAPGINTSFVTFRRILISASLVAQRIPRYTRSQ